MQVDGNLIFYDQSPHDTKQVHWKSICIDNGAILKLNDLGAGITIEKRNGGDLFCVGSLGIAPGCNPPVNSTAIGGANCSGLVFMCVW